MKNITLAEYQKLVEQLVKQRGFEKETPHQVFALLIEEVGELSKALRKLDGIKSDKNSQHHILEEEAADVFFMLVDFCNRMDMDLEQAFADKEAKNQQRNWA